MSIPTLFAPIFKQDFTLRPIKVHKSYFLSGSEFATTSSGYNLVEGYYTNLKTPIGSPKADNDPRNTSDNSYKHVIWQSINHLYYKHPYDAGKSFEHFNSRYTYKFLNLTASMISIPYMDFGERIKKQSVVITNGNIILQDDGNGNLYDVAREEYLVNMSRNNLRGYWGFNNEFRKFKYGFGIIGSEECEFQSSKNHTNQRSIINDIEFTPGITISGSNTCVAAKFNGTSSFVMTKHDEAFNFDSTENFMISFWMKVDSYPSSSQSLISKNGVEYVNQYGTLNKILDSGQIVKTKFISGSTIDSITDVYPFDISLSGSAVYFKRSDGINTLTLNSLTGSLTTGSWNHISVTRYNYNGTAKIGMYVNGTYQTQGIDTTIHPLNNKNLMFASRTLSGSNQYNGYLDEVRIYNNAFFTGSHISSSILHQSIANPTHAYNTSVVGNVFYKQGRIVVSAHDDRYKNIFSGSWHMIYEGTHTIYEYECLCRVRKGDFNLSLNPSARKSPKSDELIDEMTGSLLYPYATTIGLYNDQGVLVALGKMGQAVQMREDVDINFLVRWDA